MDANVPQLLGHELPAVDERGIGVQQESDGSSGTRLYRRLDPLDQQVDPL